MSVCDDHQRPIGYHCQGLLSNCCHETNKQNTPIHNVARASLLLQLATVRVSPAPPPPLPPPPRTAARTLAGVGGPQFPTAGVCKEHCAKHGGMVHHEQHCTKPMPAASTLHTPHTARASHQVHQGRRLTQRPTCIQSSSSWGHTSPSPSGGSYTCARRTVSCSP
jgi:hypothetical protein